MSDKPLPQVTVTIDKLSVVRHVSEENRKYLKAQFLHLAEDQPTVFVNGGSKAGYRVNVYGTLPGPTTVLFQCDPHKSTLPFIRLETNPSKVSPTGGSPLTVYFEWMFNFGFAEFASKAKVTRLDVAIDVDGYAPTDIVCGTVKKTKSATYAGKSGETETLYLGKMAGTPFAIYNKSLQLKMSGQRTRIEKRTKPDCFLAYVGKGKNPLADLRVYETDVFRKALAVLPLEGDLLCSLAQAKGIRGALAACPEPVSSALKAKIDMASQCAWWDPAHFWSLVPDYLTARGLLQPTEHPAALSPKIKSVPVHELAQLSSPLLS